MTLNHSSVEIFTESLVNKLFKILPLYEEGTDDVTAYTESLAIQLDGFANVSELGRNIDYLNLLCTLYGLIKELQPKENHKTIKREVFKMISLAKSLSNTPVKEGV